MGRSFGPEGRKVKPNTNKSDKPGSVIFTHDLTPAEKKVLTLRAEGFTNAVIGEQLYISEETVKTHIKHIILKTGARNTTHAVTSALRAGVIQ